MRTRCGRSRGGGFGERGLGARGGNPSVRCGGRLPPYTGEATPPSQLRCATSPYTGEAIPPSEAVASSPLRTETPLWDVPVFRPAYSALPKRSDFSRFAAYEGELRMLLQTLL